MYVEVPTACAIFPKELFKSPEKWVRQFYNVVQMSYFTSGGHFAALEEPQVLADDIRKFASIVLEGRQERQASSSYRREL